MVSFKNKKLSLIEVRQDKLFSDLILLVIKHVPKEGLSYDDIKNRMRLEDAILNKEEDQEISMEDADISYLKSLVSSFKWAIYSRSLVEFTESINQLK